MPNQHNRSRGQINLVQNSTMSEIAAAIRLLFIGVHASLQSSFRIHLETFFRGHIGDLTEDRMWSTPPISFSSLTHLGMALMFQWFVLNLPHYNVPFQTGANAPCEGGTVIH